MEINDMHGEANCSYVIRNIEGDMGQKTRLHLILQADGDVVLTIDDIERGRQGSIEFCSVGSGGGRNPIIVDGLKDIIRKLVAAEKSK